METFKFISNPVVINTPQESWVQFYTMEDQPIQSSFQGDGMFSLPTVLLGSTLKYQILPNNVDLGLKGDELLDRLKMFLEGVINFKTYQGEQTGFDQPIKIPDGMVLATNTIFLTDYQGIPSGSEVFNGGHSLSKGEWLPIYKRFIYGVNNTFAFDGEEVYTPTKVGSFYMYDNMERFLCIMPKG